MGEGASSLGGAPRALPTTPAAPGAICRLFPIGQATAWLVRSSGDWVFRVPIPGLLLARCWVWSLRFLSCEPGEWTRGAEKLQARTRHRHSACYVWALSVALIRTRCMQLSPGFCSGAEPVPCRGEGRWMVLVRSTDSCDPIQTSWGDLMPRGLRARV